MVLHQKLKYSFNNPVSAISALISIILSCMLVGIPSFISEFLYRHRDLAITDPNFKKIHASYISGFRVKANIMNLMYYPIFMFRRLLFAAIIVLLYNYPEVQLAFINIGTVAFIFYMIYWKPFKNKFSLYSAASSETFFAVFTTFLYGLTSEHSDSVNSIMGWIMISTIGGALLTSWICIVLQQVRAWKFHKAIQEKKEAIKRLEEERIQKEKSVNSDIPYNGNKETRNETEKMESVEFEKKTDSVLLGKQAFDTKSVTARPSTSAALKIKKTLTSNKIENVIV